MVHQVCCIWNYPFLVGPLIACSIRSTSASNSTSGSLPPGTGTTGVGRKLRLEATWPVPLVLNR